MDRILKAIGATKRFRDPIYGFIRLTESELKIIDTSLFQRLRRIHQLALTKYVYPNAEHSRFVHSLGTVHASTAMFAAVLDNAGTERRTDVDNFQHARILRFAALLHDIGHIPFSHAAEDAWLGGINHEQIGGYIITHYQPIRDVIDDTGIDPKAVASLVTKTYKPLYRLIGEILSGQLDADRADFLLRDSHFCGVKYGEYDFDRYSGMFAATDTGGSFRLIIDEKDLHVAEAFLIARYHYYMQVPFHRTRCGLDKVLEKFLIDQNVENTWFETDADGNLTDVDFEKFESLDDYSLFDIFKKKAAQGDFWARCLLRLDHLKLVLDETYNLDSAEKEFKDFVRLIEKNNYEYGRDFFTSDKKIAILKDDKDEATDQEDGTPSVENYNSILVRKRTGSDEEQQIVDIRDISWIFQHIAKKPTRILRVYVIPDRYKAALDLWKQIKGGVRGRA